MDWPVSQNQVQVQIVTKVPITTILTYTQTHTIGSYVGPSVRQNTDHNSLISEELAANKHAASLSSHHGTCSQHCPHIMELIICDCPF